MLSIVENDIKKRLHKWLHYFPIYERYFDKFRVKAENGEKIKILEIGIFGGGSLELWSKYFGKNCEIYGIDIDPVCKKHECDNVKIEIGNQADKNFLKNFTEKYGDMDIIIDDGGHRMNEQIISLQVLFPHVRPGGVYLCEDTHTSYWPVYGGGLRRQNTFIEYSKELIDEINGYHHGQKTYITENCSSMHYHDSIVVFEKSETYIQKPYDKMWNPNN